MHYTLRPLCADDEPFLWQMLYYAARVNEEEGRTIDDMRNDPVMPNYVTGWGRPGDLGFVAVDGDSGAPLGAAWLRLPTAAGGGYSASDPNTPELAIAVLPAFIGQGIGTRLMEALISAARGQYPAIILNVRKENPAQKLYARLGFTTIREMDNRVGGRSLEMICKLGTETQAMDQNRALIRHIEEASLNAWPAHQCLVDRGWLLRFADGYTRRSNSVNPIYSAEAESECQVMERIARCEAHYRTRKQPPIFKMTPLTQPAHLDNLLAARGYVHEAPTTVRQRSLADPMPVSETEGIVQIEDTTSDTWIKDFARFSDLKDGQVAALRAILQNIVPMTGYATLRVNGKAAACALAVVEGSTVGLYDIVTAPAARGRGYAVHMLAALAAWANAQGAALAYLQVTDNNLSAKRLYDKLGFTELYPYWYRVQRG